MRSLDIDVVLWDWNGTLLDDGSLGLQIINSMLERRGMPVRTAEEHGRLFDFPVIRYYERLGFDFSREPFEVVSQEFVDAYLAGVAGCSLRPQAEAHLQALARAGFRQSVLSASRQDYLEQQVRHFGLDGYFDELLGIDSVHAPGKSARGCAWIRERHLDPERILLIGDTVHDAEVAREMGIHCWLVSGGHHPRERLESTGCHCLESLAAAVHDLTGNGGSPA